jgi:hypothetical protein
VYATRNTGLVALSKFGQAWRRAWVRRRAVPPRLSLLWGNIMRLARTPIHEVPKHLGLCQDILELCAIADEACQGIGSPLDGNESDVDEEFLYHAAGLLHRDLPGSSVCDVIHSSRLRVLPKMHTPQNGLTIRSLSLYVCLCAPNEVVPAWIEAMSPLVDDSLNLLVIPWPMEIFPAQFQVAEPLPAEMSNMPDQFGFFTFAHKPPTTSVVEVVKSLYDGARDEVGRVDGVVLPELALSLDEHRDLRDYVLEQGSFLVSGVGIASNAPSSRGQNRVCLDLPFTRHFHNKSTTAGSLIPHRSLNMAWAVCSIRSAIGGSTSIWETADFCSLQYTPRWFYRFSFARTSRGPIRLAI